MTLLSRKRTRSETAGAYALIAQIAPPGFPETVPEWVSRNGASKMEKRDGYLSSSIGIKRCHLTRHAIYAPWSVPARAEWHVNGGP